MLGDAIALEWWQAGSRLSEKRDELVTTQAVTIGETIAAQVAATRAIYNRDIVGSLKPTGAKSCVSCHNKLEQTAEIQAMRAGQPVKQFELGGLMGSVVTTVPIAKSQAIVAELASTQASANAWI